MAKPRISKLTSRNAANSASGPPKDEFRRNAGEKLDHWLGRADAMLEELFDSAESTDARLKAIEAAGKLAERFGKYTGFEKAESGDGKMVIEIVRVATPIVEDD